MGRNTLDSGFNSPLSVHSSSNRLNICMDIKPTLLLKQYTLISEPENRDSYIN